MEERRRDKQKVVFWSEWAGGTEVRKEKRRGRETERGKRWRGWR